MVPLSSVYDTGLAMSSYPGQSGHNSATPGHSSHTGHRGHMGDNNNMERLLSGKSGYQLGLTSLADDKLTSLQLHDSKLTGIPLQDSCWPTGYIETGPTRRQKSQVNEDQTGTKHVKENYAP